MQPDYQHFELEAGRVVNIGTRMSQKMQALGSLIESFGGEVLDVGCDFGFWSFLAKERGASRVLGLDRGRDVRGQGFVDLVALNNSRNVEGVKFREQNIGRQWHEHGQFDTVFCMSVYHHILNNAGGCHDSVFYWLRRHLKPGGRLIWEGPLTGEDIVVQRNVHPSIHAKYTPYDILSAAEMYFDHERIGGAIHEDTREVYLMTPRDIPTKSARMVVSKGAGGAEKAFKYGGGRRSNEIARTMGWHPFAGTLNLKGEDFPYWYNYYAAPLMELKDRKTGLDGEWMPRWCGLHPVTLRHGSKEAKGIAMRFANDYYPNSLVEVVAPQKLRDQLCVKDGDTVEVTND